MSTIDRRHAGRAIRKIRRSHGPTAGVVTVTLTPDTRAFERALHDIIRHFERFAVTAQRRPQILHNGRKPR